MTDSRTNRITFYVDDEEKQALQREANNAGESMSSYCLRLIRQQRKQETEDQLAEDFNVEQRLEEITQRAIDRIDERHEKVEETTEALRDLHARAGNYPLVNFRLLMRTHRPPEAWIDEQFEWSRTRLREPVSDHDPTEGIATDSDTDADQDDRNGGVEDVDDLI